MTLRNAKLSLRPGHGIVEIDGRDLASAVRDLDLSAGVNETPRLSLDLIMHEVEVDGEMTVVIPDSTRKTLTASGGRRPPKPDPTQKETHDGSTER